MRDNQMKYLVMFGAFAISAWLIYSVTGGTGFAAGPQSVCGNGICELGESYGNCPMDCKQGQTPAPAAAVCGDGVCGATESSSTCPADCTIQAGLTCPSDATTSFEVNVRDVLNETGYNRLAVTVKKIGPNGLLIDEDTSSSSSSTIMKVPCEKSTYRLIAYDDDNSGIDIYPVELSVNAYTVQNGALAGGRIPVTLNAMQQGTIAVAVYDSSGGGSTDKNITFAQGETNPYTRIMVRQTEDDKAAMNIMCMMNYTTSKFKKIEWNGYSPAGLTVQNAIVPQVYSGNGGYAKAWNLMLNGQPLTLDADSRTAAPDRVYYDLNIYSYADVDPGQHNVTFRCIDRMKYWEADGVTWANGGQPAAEDDSGTNLGIQQANELVDEGIMFYE